MPRGRDVAELRGRLSGATVFVLGNGPSVVEHELSRLRGRHVIGMNASPVLDARFGFESEYYAVSDARCLLHPEKRTHAIELPSPRTVRVLRADLRPHDAPSLVAQTYYVAPLGKNGFSEDLRRGYYFGCSTAMLAIQLAAYLDAAHIALLGCDFKYPKDQPRFYEEAAPQSHDPFLSVQIWNVRNAYRVLRARGVSLWLCSRSSNLVPYVPFRAFEELVGE